jgi:hypothetical protein
MVKALAALVLLGAMLAATELEAAATVSCDFRGKTVQVVIVNSKDSPRSCNAMCVWRYGNVAFRGAGGAILANGETRTVYNSSAPSAIDGVVTSDITCNR